MGAQFARLAPALRHFHSLRGTHTLQGQVRTEPPTGRLAGWLARGLGTPRQASHGAIRFELRAQAAEEHWLRHFPGQRMSSVLRLREGRVCEHLGLARLSFELHATHDGQLQMQLHRLHFLGLPCPAWLRPEILAEERGEQSPDGYRLHFHVRARVPGLGLVSEYRGHLDLGPAPEARP